MKPAFNHRCSRCKSKMERSRVRGARETLAFILGGDIRRCVSCGARFLCFRRFRIPAPAHTGYATNNSDESAFAIVWVAIFAGVLACLGIALWTLRRFHRWPF
jgi:hypothetical protein